MAVIKFLTRKPCQELTCPFFRNHAAVLKTTSENSAASILTHGIFIPKNEWLKTAAIGVELDMVFYMESIPQKGYFHLAFSPESVPAPGNRGGHACTTLFVHLYGTSELSSKNYRWEYPFKQANQDVEQGSVYTSLMCQAKCIKFVI